MDAVHEVERIRDDSRDGLSSRYIFRLSAVEEQFRRIYPNDNFGICWQLVDQRVQEYPGLFTAGEYEERLEGVELSRDAEGNFSFPDIRDVAAREKVRRALESLVGRIMLDGSQHVVRQSDEGRGAGCSTPDSLVELAQHDTTGDLDR